MEDGSPDLFHGLVYEVGERTGNMLIKCRQATLRFGMEAMIPGRCNPSGAVLGDRVSFKLYEQLCVGHPIAINVIVLSQVDLGGGSAKLQEGANLREIAPPPRLGPDQAKEGPWQCASCQTRNYAWRRSCYWCHEQGFVFSG